MAPGPYVTCERLLGRAFGLEGLTHRGSWPKQENEETFVVSGS